MDHEKQHEMVFTSRGALLGLVAYSVVAVIVAWVFLR
jgi:hypothetical protein